MDGPQIMDAPDFIAGSEDIDNRIYTMQESVAHEVERLNTTSGISRFAMDYTHIKTTVSSYEAVIKQLQDRITEIEHKIEQLTGPCCCESLL